MSECMQRCCMLVENNVRLFSLIETECSLYAYMHCGRTYSGPQYVTLEDDLCHIQVFGL